MVSAIKRRKILWNINEIKKKKKLSNFNFCIVALHILFYQRFFHRNILKELGKTFPDIRLAISAKIRQFLSQFLSLEIRNIWLVLGFFNDRFTFV